MRNKEGEVLAMYKEDDSKIILFFSLVVSAVVKTASNWKKWKVTRHNL